MGDQKELHEQELRRGTVVLACLLLLRRSEYGYQLLEALQAAGIDVDANTLYPLLRRLEKQGLLESQWNTEESRPRKYYTTSVTGQQVAADLATEWKALDGALRALMEEGTS
ncbi:MAG: PadR family transcriptional regulator [Candidatus Nanopelagicales bacterium]